MKVLIASFQLVFYSSLPVFLWFHNPTQCCTGTQSRVLFDIPNVHVIHSASNFRSNGVEMVHVYTFHHIYFGDIPH